jgi:hypothetical protein
VTGDDFHAGRAEAEVKREAASDLLAHIDARRAADKARGEQLLAQIIVPVEGEAEAEHDDHALGRDLLDEIYRSRQPEDT